LIPLALTACESLLGVDFDRAHLASPGAGGDADGSTDHSSSGGSAGASGAGNGGSGGDAGSGGVGAADAAGDAADGSDGAAGCTSGSSCYNGPARTVGVGACTEGVIDCTDTGSVCTGEITPAFENTSALPDESCDTFTGNHEFSWAFGGSGAQAGVNVDLDSSGNIFLAGNFATSFSLGTKALATNGSGDLFVAKLDSQTHEVVWASAFGSANNDVLHGLAVDSGGNVVIAGVISGPVDFGDGNVLTPPAGKLKIFAAKFTNTGALVWSKLFPGMDASVSENLYEVAVDKNDHAYLVGVTDADIQFGSTPLIDAGTNDAYLVKLDGATGNPLWSRGFVGPGVEVNIGVTTDATNRVVVMGTTTSSLTVAGMTIEGTGARSYFLVLDETGSPVLNRALGLTSGPSGGYYEIAQPATDPATSAIVVSASYIGTFTLGGQVHQSLGGEDIVIAKFDSGGTHLWSRSFGGPVDEDNPKAVAVDNDGNVIVASEVEQGIDCGGGQMQLGGLDDVFLAKLDGMDGKTLWCRQLGLSSLDQPAGMAVGTGNDIWVTGEFGGQLAFGPTQLNAVGGAPDGFLFRLAP
jgi:hypothetical protein